MSVEANFSSYPIRELERLRYPRQYVRQTEDSFTHKIRQSYGFQTNKNTRPVVIAGLVEIVREHSPVDQRPGHAQRDAHLCAQRERQARGPGGRPR